MFTQEIRWSRQAQSALAALYVYVITTVWWPLFVGKAPRSSTAILVLTGMAATALFGWVFATFTVLRIAIDDSELIVGFGRLQERVAFDQITACGPTSYYWLEWGGWGIRMHRRGRLYNVPGDGGAAVQLNLAGGRQLLFSSPDPAAVCAALRERRPEIEGLPQSSA